MNSGKVGKATFMGTNSSVLITEGTGSFGETFVQTTFAKYYLCRLGIYSCDDSVITSAHICGSTI